MQLPLNYESKFTIDPKVQFEFQALGIEYAPKFGKVLWSLFYKYPVPKMREALLIADKRGIYKISYLIGILHKLK